VNSPWWLVELILPRTSAAVTKIEGAHAGAIRGSQSLDYQETPVSVGVSRIPSKSLLSGTIWGQWAS
jgi:hypothetical protein